MTADSRYNQEQMHLKGRSIITSQFQIHTRRSFQRSSCAAKFVKLKITISLAINGEGRVIIDSTAGAVNNGESKSKMCERKKSEEKGGVKDLSEEVNCNSPSELLALGFCASC